MASMAYPVIAFKPTSIACCARQFLPGVVGPSRADWQSTCAILSKESAIFHQQPEENNNKLVNIPALNGHIAPSDLELILISNLSRPLTIADHAPTPMHGSSIRVAYQGVPGAYSEAAAGRAYPNCEAIPCDQFEVAFQAVELWIADRAVLPVQPNVITGEFQFYPLNLNSLIINDRISGV